MVAPQPALTWPFAGSICMAMTRPKLEITLCAPRGFCAGVDRAIQILEKPIERQTLEGLFATVLKTTGDYRKPVRRARAN